MSSAQQVFKNVLLSQISLSGVDVSSLDVPTTSLADLLNVLVGADSGLRYSYSIPDTQTITGTGSTLATPICTTTGIPINFGTTIKMEAGGTVVSTASDYFETRLVLTINGSDYIAEFPIFDPAGGAPPTGTHNFHMQAILNINRSGAGPSFSAVTGSSMVVADTGVYTGTHFLNPSDGAWGGVIGVKGEVQLKQTGSSIKLNQFKVEVHKGGQ